GSAPVSRQLTSECPMTLPHENLSARDAYHRREAILERFEEAWHGGTPKLAEYLETAAATERPELLIELVRLDLEMRLTRGWVAALEMYLAAYPELATRPEAVSTLVESEWSARRAAGLPCKVDDFAARFPALWPAVAGRLGLASETELPASAGPAPDTISGP